MRPDILACAALHHWAYSAATGATPPTSDADALLHRTAWMVAGETRPPGSTWPEQPATALRSIFSRIGQEHRTRSSALMRPATLALERERLFPTLEVRERDGDAITNLRRSLDQLDARNLPPSDQLEGLLFALQHHAWALSSPLPAVSLYDFARHPDPARRSAHRLGCHQESREVRVLFVGALNGRQGSRGAVKRQAPPPTRPCDESP